MESDNRQYTVDFQSFDLNQLEMFQGFPTHDTVQFIDNLVKRKKSRKRKATTVKHASNQTPLQLLNELQPGCIFNIISADGPAHCPNFVVSLEIKGQTFTGTASSKQLAKQKAAYEAISVIFPHKITDIALNLEKKPTNVTNGKSKKVIKLENIAKRAVTGETNPIMALNELMPGIKYECIINQGPQSLITPFSYKFQVGDVTYHGSGGSKQAAKAAAARSFFIGTDTELELNDPIDNSIKFNQLYANKIYDLVNTKFETIVSQVPDFARRKVLSAIIMTTSYDFSDSQVLNLTTGTKCICGEYLSCKGTSLNDCHAEIISRRALVSFFYDQLELHGRPATANSSIFILKENGKGFKLKPDIEFHLYVSTSCCGDARIFSPHEKTDLYDKHPNRQSRGQLRTKIESGEGTIPVKSSNNIQTWDGIMVGQKLLTMSCSDKVAKWNVVGVQGSLLSHFVDPIYLKSITLGSLFHPVHTKRALFGRIENTLPPLPEPFKLNKILMSSVTSLEPRQTGKAPSYSLNWLSHDPVSEIIDAATGKTLTGEISRLCKMNLFTKFKELLKLKLPQHTELNQQFSNVYFNVKESSTDYMKVKHKFFQACAEAGLGNWIKKPMEQDHFEVN